VSFQTVPLCALEVVANAITQPFLRAATPTRLGRSCVQFGEMGLVCIDFVRLFALYL
jgi:hypothetical protein